MLKGLKKRESYEELINELGEDPIKRYPNRSASQIENTNYMSQLASGFKEVIEQHDRVLKEQTKELLLQEIAAAPNAASHHTFKSLSSLGLNQLMQAPQRLQQYNIQTPPSPRSVKSGQQAPRHMDMDDNADLREMRYRLWGPDIDPQVVFQAFDNAREQQEREREQQEREQQLIAQVRQDHEYMMKNNPFEGIFSGKAVKKEKKEVKEEKKKKVSIKKTVKKDKIEPEKEPPLPKGRPKGTKKQYDDDDDDEVEITHIQLNENKTMSYWKSQSAKEIRNQLKLRNVPSDAQWIYKKNLLKIVSNLIKTKKW